VGGDEEHMVKKRTVYECYVKERPPLKFIEGRISNFGRKEEWVLKKTVHSTNGWKDFLKGEYGWRDMIDLPIPPLKVVKTSGKEKVMYETDWDRS
jgi:hypothetical protein